MVVVKLYGDEWALDEKIVASLKPQVNFASQLALFIKKLGIEDFNGLCFYHTEGGRPPGSFIRPTTPIAINSTPQREKITDGYILYIKAADLQKQKDDVDFEDGFREWRKTKGIAKPDPQGADFKEYIGELTNNLSKGKAAEINESEALFRSKIEVEEFRGFRDITFELRDVMQMSDDCEAAMSKEFDEWLGIVSDLHYNLILLPSFADQRLQFEREELKQRDGVEDEWNFETSEVMDRESANRTRIEEIIFKREEEERKKREEEDRKRREEEARLRREEEERQRRLRLEEDARKQAEQNAKLKELELLAQIGRQRERFAAPETVKQIVDDAVAESSTQMQSIIRDEVAKVTNELRDYVHDNMRESKRRLDELLAYLLPFHNSAIAASFGAQLTHNAELIDLYEDHVKDLGKQVEQRVAQAKLAMEDKKKAEEAAEQQCRLLIEEQKQLLEDFGKSIEQNELEQKEQQQELEEERNNAITTLFDTILSSRTVLDAIALEHQRNNIMKEAKIASTNAHYQYLMEERVRETEMRQHNNSYYFSRFVAHGRQYPLDKERDVPALDVDTHAIISVFAERHGISAEEVADLIERFDSDAWQIADELMFRTDLAATSSQFEFAREYVEEHAPNLRPVLDLLLDVYKGREVEVVAAIVSTSQTKNPPQHNDNWSNNNIMDNIITNNAEDYVEGCDDGGGVGLDNNNENNNNNMIEINDGGPMKRIFYCHKTLERSQWLCPRCWEQ